jgi:hypothetical protein
MSGRATRADVGHAHIGRQSEQDSGFGGVE